MGRMKKKPNNTILQADTKIQDACEALRDFVDNINKQPSVILTGKVYKSRDASKIQTVTVDGVEIGYRLQDFERFIRRQVFVKVPGYRIDDLTDSEHERIMTAIFNVFLTIGAGRPSVSQIAVDCMLIEQDVVTMHLIERSPGLVSIAGGLG